MKRAFLITLFAISTSLITACGGGGGGSSTTTSTPVPVPEPVPVPVPEQLSINIDSSSITMDESSSNQIKLSYANTNGDVSLTLGSFVSDFSAEQYKVTADNTDKTITVDIGDVYIDGTLSFTVTGSDNSKTDSVDVTVSVSNTSVVKTLNKLAVLTASFDSISGESETRKVLSRLNDLSLLLGVITEADAFARMQSIDSALDESLYADLSNALKNKDHIAMYKAGTNELALIEILATIEQDLPLYSRPFYELIIDAQQLLGEQVIPPFPENNFYVDIENQTISRFWMNPEMGKIIDEKYSFNSEYAYLTAVLFPETQSCNQ